VQRHGGTITAQSQLGAGTCFRVTLPIRQPPVNRSAKETA
jgi:signal transduction histidine kinase